MNDRTLERYHRMDPKHIRFWVIINNSPVRLALRDGQTLTHRTGGPTDEGWQRYMDVFTRDGCEVRSIGHTEGRDCDGPYESWGEHKFEIDIDGYYDTHDGTYPGIRWPVWGRVTAGQRDLYAEAMGY